MKTGTPVRIKQPTLEGVVVKRKFDEDDNELLLVRWAEADGDLVEAWLQREQLEEVVAEEPAPAQAANPEEQQP